MKSSPATMTIPYYEFSWWIIIQLQTDWQFRRNHFHLYFVWTFFVSYDFLHIQSTRVRATYSIGTAEIKRAFFPLPVNIFKSILKYLLKNGRIRTVSFSRNLSFELIYTLSQGWVGETLVPFVPVALSCRHHRNPEEENHRSRAWAPIYVIAEPR